MMEFHSIQGLFEQSIIPLIQKLEAALQGDDEGLKITTTWIVNEGEELVILHENLNIPFKNMHVIVNTCFFKPWERLKPYPQAYHEISKNSRWESIDTIIKRGEKIFLHPISFISLISCFKGKGNKQVKLSDILNHLTYPDTEKRLLVVLSSEGDEEKKRVEIEEAKAAIIRINEDVDIGEFIITDEGGGYNGFWASF